MTLNLAILKETVNEFLSLDNDIYLKTLIKYDMSLLESMNNIKSLNEQINNLNKQIDNLNYLNYSLKTEIQILNEKIQYLINKMVWFIPLKKLRNYIRYKIRNNFDNIKI
ncbi:hypothetical protein [uncultured Brachyspira sp.]|uniref:hypothetical protein n=1 Tax=uncultured Brachyspira sp. TaxID=221953 RepID=UPI0025FAD567|nr:hypothetical protein [uncultured Brachyspira sp.]